MFANIVYVLCAATSTLCAALLIRGYRSSHARLLLWSAVCFVGLALNNILLLVDVTVFAGIGFSTWRMVPAVLGTGALLYSLIWEAQ
jgi:hypothetical protein